MEHLQGLVGSQTIMSPGPENSPLCRGGKEAQKGQEPPSQPQVGEQQAEMALRSPCGLQNLPDDELVLVPQINLDPKGAER